MAEPVLADSDEPGRFRLLTASDLHLRPKLFAGLESAVATYKPDVVAIVGDLLDASGSSHGLSLEVAARRIAALDCSEVILVRGNHEAASWLPFHEAWPRNGRPLNVLHCASKKVGPFYIIGFPCFLGDEGPFVATQIKEGTHPDLEALRNDSSYSMKVERWLPPLVRSAPDGALNLWLLHEPPRGTPIAADHPIMAREIWTAAIQRYQPELTISGHDHHTPLEAGGTWHCQVDQTTCCNAGQTDDGPLQYLLVETVPVSRPDGRHLACRVTCHPRGETIEVSRVRVV